MTKDEHLKEAERLEKLAEEAKAKGLRKIASARRKQAAWHVEAAIRLTEF